MNSQQQVTVKQQMQALGQQARAASRVVAAADTNIKNRALLAMAEALRTATPALIEANEKDLAAGRAKGLDAAMLDRLEQKH